MAWKINLLRFAVTVILTSLKLCDGQAEEEEADMGRPTVQGSHHLRSAVSGLKLGPAAQTRPGSLSFKYNRQDISSNPTNGKFQNNPLSTKTDGFSFQKRQRLEFVFAKIQLNLGRWHLTTKTRPRIAIPSCGPMLLLSLLAIVLWKGGGRYKNNTIWN